MTGELINLRRARKARARVERERDAAENRARFGQTKADRQKTAAEDRLAERRIDAHRRDVDKT
jgi:hypothetical protein